MSHNFSLWRAASRMLPASLESIFPISSSLIIPVLPCPFYRIDEFLLRSHKLRAVYLSKEFAFLHIPAGVINMELFDPAFKLRIDRGKPLSSYSMRPTVLMIF